MGSRRARRGAFGLVPTKAGECFEWQIKDIGERLRVVSSEKWAKRAFAR